MMLEGQKPIEVKKGYHLSMQLPKSLVRKPKITFDAKSVCCKRGWFWIIQSRVSTAKPGCKSWKRNQQINGKI